MLIGEIVKREFKSSQMNTSELAEDCTGIQFERRVVGERRSRRDTKALKPIIIGKLTHR
jgi:hypothetical protein